MILYQLRPIPMPLPTHTIDAASRRHCRSRVRFATFGTEATTTAGRIDRASIRLRVFGIDIIINKYLSIVNAIWTWKGRILRFCKYRYINFLQIPEIF